MKYIKCAKNYYSYQQADMPNQTLYVLLWSPICGHDLLTLNEWLTFFPEQS
jgi:hypothetical protein